MGNFHCITSSCAEVVYKEYLPPMIRWRYEGEEWQEIEGDDYTVEESQDCSGLPWQFLWSKPFGVRREGDQCIPTNWSPPTLRSNFNYSNETPFTNLRVEVGSRPVVSSEDVNANTDLTGSFAPLVFGSCRYGNTSIKIIVDTPVAKDRIILNTSGFNIRVWEFKPSDADLPKCTNQCVFTITKNGEIVHTETRNTCPEVEILSCRLSDERKVIYINKRAWWEKIQVVDNYSTLINESISNGIEAIEEFLYGEIPENCREIWVTPSFDLPNFNWRDTGITIFTEAYRLVGQICSVPDCPPPEFQVICDQCEPDCEECPGDTCAIECDDHICCYDLLGQAIKSIAIENYCGGTS